MEQRCDCGETRFAAQQRLLQPFCDLPQRLQLLLHGQAATAEQARRHSFPLCPKGGLTIFLQAKPYVLLSKVAGITLRFVSMPCACPVKDRIRALAIAVFNTSGYTVLKSS